MFKNWEKINLTLDTDPEKYFENTKLFFDALEEDYKKFIEDGEQKRIIRPNWEGCEINSPISILNGRWGSGKTYFIENFLDNFDKHKEQSELNLIKEIQILDAMDIVESEDIIYGFVAEILKSKMGMKSKSLNLSKKLGKFSLNLIINAINTIPVFDIDSFKNEEEMFAQIESVKISKKNNDATLIIIDNLERLGKDVYKVLKLIYKLRKVEGFIFLLVTNVNAIDSNINKDEKEVEFPIYKFVNLVTFNFSQNYEPIINKLNSNNIKISNEEIEIINKSFNNIDGIQQMTIRQFESWLIATDYLSKEKMIERYRLISELGIDVKEIFAETYNKKIEFILTTVEEILNLKYEFLKYVDNQELNNENYANYIVDEKGYFRPKNAPKDLVSNDGNFKIYTKYKNSYANYEDENINSKWVVDSVARNYEFMKSISLNRNDLDDSFVETMVKTIKSDAINEIENLIDLSFKIDLFNLDKFKKEINLLKELFEKVFLEIDEEIIKLESKISKNLENLHVLKSKYIYLLDRKNKSDEHIALVEKFEEVKEEHKQTSMLDSEYPTISRYKHELEEKIKKNFEDEIYDEDAQAKLDENINNQSTIIDENEKLQINFNLLSDSKKRKSFDEVSSFLSKIDLQIKKIQENPYEEMLYSNEEFIIEKKLDFDTAKKIFIEKLLS